MAPKTQICASLNATNVKDAAEQMRVAAAAGADLAELRLDLLGKDVDPQKDLRQLISSSSLPLITSCLPTSLGYVHHAHHRLRLCVRHACRCHDGRALHCRGAFEGDEAQRLSLLRASAQEGVRYVDIDLDAAHSLRAGMHLMMRDHLICEQVGTVDTAAAESCFRMLHRWGPAAKWHRHHCFPLQHGLHPG